MILRVVSGTVRPGDLDTVAASFRRAYVPVAEQTAGLARFVIGARPTPDGGHDLALMTIWITVEDALAAYSGNLAAIRTLDSTNHGEQLIRVDYYEIDATHDPPDDPAAGRPGHPELLRVSAGRVARGLDADIQQELRRNLPSLAPEAGEAWIGRRVLEGDVEIAFVSTWTAAPAGQSLDEPIWPAVSGRYDTFAVSVHQILLEGVGRT